MSTEVANHDDVVARLCPSCGLCCNGVLFGDVELQRGDDAKQLAGLGLVMFRKGRRQCFSQPCACLHGPWCRIYEERPTRCRTFECKLLKQVLTGRVTAPAALRRITDTCREVEKVRRLVQELGHTDESVPLNRRYAAVIAAPIDLAADEPSVKRRSELMQAVHQLVQSLECDFLG